MSTLHTPDDDVVPTSSELERPPDEAGRAPATLEDTGVQPAIHPPEQGSRRAATAEQEGSSLEHPQAIDPFETDEIRVDPNKVRHAPRFGRFATVGGLLGMALAFLLAPFARYENLDAPWHLDPWGLALMLTVILVPLGILGGCVVALTADRRSGRRLGR